MMTFRTLVALMLAAALLLSASRSHSSPLASCSNVGFSPGNYTITGTTHNVTSSDTIADVNALSVRPGDAVLFEAGTTWNIRSENNRLKTKAGVLYGRYGAGPNPVISATGVPFSINFRGIIEIDGVDDVTVDGIDVRGAASDNFGIMARNADNITVSRLTVSNLRGGGVVFITGTTNITVDKIEIFNVDGGPHEALTFDGTDGYVVSYVHSHNNGHAAINNKGNAKNGEVFGSEFSQTSNDPVFYIERAENLNVHDNWIHTATGASKPLLTLGIEDFGPQSTQYNRNNEIHNNVFEGTGQFGVRMWIKDEVKTSTTRIQHNNHIHHNSIINVNNEDQSWWHGNQAIDLRPTPNPGDWSANVIENNIIWDTKSADGIHFDKGTVAGFTVRNNLFQKGETGGSDLGTNAMFTDIAPFASLARKNYTPAGAALGAGSDGSDIGANIDWSCGTGTRDRFLQPKPPTPDDSP